MKRLCIFLLSCLLPLSALSQTQSLEFVYVAHDRTTPVNALCERLTEIHDYAMQDESMAVIFYLANADAPRIVRMNLPGDNRDDLGGLLGEIRYKSAHEIFPDVDQEEIVRLFDEVDFLNDSGNPSFTSFKMTWSVNPTFWSLGYNESLIARLFFTLDLGSLSGGYFNMEVWHARNDGLKYDEEMPFGPKNLCGDYPFFLLEYR